MSSRHTVLGNMKKGSTGMKRWLTASGAPCLRQPPVDATARVQNTLRPAVVSWEHAAGLGDPLRYIVSEENSKWSYVSHAACTTAAALALAAAFTSGRDTTARAEKGESIPPWVQKPCPPLTWSALIQTLEEEQSKLPRAPGFSAQKKLYRPSAQERNSHSTAKESTSREAIDSSGGDRGPEWATSAERAFQDAPTHVDSSYNGDERLDEIDNETHDDISLMEEIEVLRRVGCDSKNNRAQSLGTGELWQYRLEFTAGPYTDLFDVFSSVVNAFCGPGQAKVSSEEFASQTTLRARREGEFELQMKVPRSAPYDSHVTLQVVRSDSDARFSATEVAAVLRAYQLSQSDSGPERGSRSATLAKPSGKPSPYDDHVTNRSQTPPARTWPHTSQGIPKRWPTPRPPLDADGMVPESRTDAASGRDAQVSKAKRKLEELGAEVFIPDQSMDWSELAGYDHVKRKIEESIVLPLKYPEVYEGIIRGTRERFESILPRAILFTGPPGCGKTSVARILSSDIGVPFVNLRIESMLSKYYGETTRKLAEILETIRELGPCVIFCDEIDALGGSRDAPDAHEVTRRTLSVLLRHLDGLDGPQDSVLVAATNMPDLLDAALLSRFDVVISFDLPDRATRSAILGRYAKQLSTKEREELASMTEGFSGRELRDACQVAERTHAGRMVRKSDAVASANVQPSNGTPRLSSTASAGDGDNTTTIAGDLPSFKDYMDAVQMRAKTSIGRGRIGEQ